MDKNEYIKESINSLEGFLENIHLANNISPHESIKRLEDSVVEMLYENGDHKGNGVLVTENGYFLSANHIEDKKRNNNSPEAKYIIDNKKRVYPIERICQKNEDKDIVLIKADVPKTGKPKMYKVYSMENSKNYPRFSPVKQVSKKKGENIIKEGGLLQKNQLLSIFFLTTVQVAAGDSGGIVFSSEDGTLLGLVTGDLYIKMRIDNKNSSSYYTYSPSVCSDIQWGRELIFKEIEYLRRLK